MATISGFTAERMLEIEAGSVVDGEILADHLILTKHDGTQIDAGVVKGADGAPGAVGPAGAAGAPGALWQTGDYKTSAQAATHADPAGGTWYLCDGSATVGAALIALLGAALPDARGRGLVMKGTHTDVNAIGKNDGAVLADRRPKHAHSANGDGVHFTVYNWTGVGPWNGTTGSGGEGGGGVGPTVNRPVDAPSFVVIGNLFVHS